MFGIKRGIWLSQGDPEKSDDSEDSDFEPTTKELAEVNLAKKQKRSSLALQAKRLKRAKKERNCISTGEHLSNDGRNWGELPLPALDRIFEHLVETEECYRKILKNGAVNYHWWSAVSRPSLKTKLKLHMNSKGKTRNAFQSFRDSISNRPRDELKYLRQIQLTNFQNHLTKTLALLNEYDFDGIDTLVLLTSQLGNLQTWSQFIEKHCQDLIEFRTNALVTSFKALNSILKLQSITKIVLHDSGPVKHGLDWSNLCPQLEHLDIYYSALQSTMAGAEVLVTSLNLPNLRFLQLANISLNERGLFNFLQTSKTFLGFPKLNFLSLRRSFIPQSTTPDVLSFFLKNAESIEAIDLQGCSCFSYADLLVGIGPLHLREKLKSVDFSSTTAKNEDDFNRFFNVQGLECVIEDLSLSGIKTKANAEDFFVHFINKFVLHADRLKNLDLTKTSIEKEEARLLLERKPHLHSLTLSGCYGIPRSWRKKIQTDEFPTAIRAFYE